MRKILLLLLTASSLLNAQQRPNILWIITDDHRPDALQCVNEATLGQKENRLGFVSSPNIDALAKEGVLFVNAFTNSPACGPSRGSMISGRYPFRNGHYAFELSHQNPDFIKPTFPQILQKEGYQTAQFGKTGEYVYRWGPGAGFYNAGHYETIVHYKHDLQKNDVGDYYGQPAVGGGDEEVVINAKGDVDRYMIKVPKGEVSEEDIAKKQKFEKKYDILRSYTRSNPNLIIGGENPQPAGKTVDGMIVEEFKSFLINQGQEYQTSFGKMQNGAEDDKPLLINLGFHLPHTPILPPKEFRNRFKKYDYKVPEFDETTLTNLPPQLQKLHRTMNMTNMTDDEIQQAIQDYFAFCAYGDALIGDAVQSFKDYCDKNDEEYLIVFTVGDHSWHLGEQGIEAKFAPWRQSVHNAMIMVASDKALIPEGVVSKDLVEYVDIAPTILSTAGVDIASDEMHYLDGQNMIDIQNGDSPVRDYIVGEMNLVIGPRAYIRSEDFAFSMRTRPGYKNNLNKDIRWALDCSVEDAELALYDLRNDPLENHNLADDDNYKELAKWFRNKLGNIVLGDGRIECDWSKPNTYALSNFAVGAHDGKLEIPDNIIPHVE